MCLLPLHWRALTAQNSCSWAGKDRTFIGAVLQAPGSAPLPPLRWFRGEKPLLLLSQFSFHCFVFWTEMEEISRAWWQLIRPIWTRFLFQKQYVSQKVIKKAVIWGITLSFMWKEKAVHMTTKLQALGGSVIFSSSSSLAFLNFSTTYQHHFFNRKWW